MPGTYESYSANLTMITSLTMKGLNVIIIWPIPFTDIKLYIWFEKIRLKCYSRYYFVCLKRFNWWSLLRTNTTSITNHSSFLNLWDLWWKKTKQNNNTKTLQGPNSMLHSHHSRGSFVEKQKKSHFNRSITVPQIGQAALFSIVYCHKQPQAGCVEKPALRFCSMVGRSLWTVFPLKFSFSLHSRHFPLGKAPTMLVWPASHPSTLTTGCPETTTWSF